MALALVAIFLASVARFYHPRTGFTALIGFPEGHEYEAPALRSIPHSQYRGWGSYDGQFYAQRALDPLVRDPRVDRAMDLPPFRARRILFSSTAYVLGFGKPAWILEAYALQNVASWLVLAILLTRWLPVRSPRTLALWSVCLFSHGLLWSVRFALLDGPSLVLTALAILAAERGRLLLSAIVAGVNGLGRETNVLGVLAQPWPTSSRGWVRLLCACAIVLLPILLWEDYLWSIYRSTVFAGGDQFVLPAVGFASIARRILDAMRFTGAFSPAGLQLSIVVSLAAQGIYLIVRRRPDAAWWRVAAGYAVLLLLLDRTRWDPTTGAITRVMLPLTVGFNVLLAREEDPRHFWPWFVIGNLHVIPGCLVMPPI